MTMGLSIREDVRLSNSLHRVVGLGSFWCLQGSFSRESTGPGQTCRDGSVADKMTSARPPTEIRHGEAILKFRWEAVLIVVQSYPSLCDPMDCSMPGFPVLHHLPEFAQTHGHWIDDAIQPSHPLSASSALIFPSIRVFSNELGCLHQVAEVLELQLQGCSKEGAKRGAPCLQRNLCPSFTHKIIHVGCLP